MPQREYDILLASASPRRSAILRQMGVSFELVQNTVDESFRRLEIPADFVTRLAREKAAAGYFSSGGGCPVLGADTIVVIDQQIFGKPRDERGATEMLMQLSGRTHQVLTAVAITDGVSVAQCLSDNHVSFRAISKKECHAYWQTGEPIDKAGGYAIQGFGAVFVNNLVGSYSGVVGLPIQPTHELLSLFGVPVWRMTC